MRKVFVMLTLAIVLFTIFYSVNAGPSSPGRVIGKQNLQQCREGDVDCSFDLVDAMMDKSTQDAAKQVASWGKAAPEPVRYELTKCWASADLTNVDLWRSTLGNCIREGLEKKKEYEARICEGVLVTKTLLAFLGQSTDFLHECDGPVEITTEGAPDDSYCQSNPAGSPCFKKAYGLGYDNEKTSYASDNDAAMTYCINSALKSLEGTSMQFIDQEMKNTVMSQIKAMQEGNCYQRQSYTCKSESGSWGKSSNYCAVGVITYSCDVCLPGYQDKIAQIVQEGQAQEARPQGQMPSTSGKPCNNNLGTCQTGCPNCGEGFPSTCEGFEGDEAWANDYTYVARATIAGGSPDCAGDEFCCVAR